MANTTRSKLTNLFTVLALVLTCFQGLIPAMPAIEPTTTTLVSALLMFFVSSFTYWKQYLSVEIGNKAMTPTIIVAVVATIGAANELFAVIPMGDLAAQWVRFGITASTMILNLVSKTLWPTDQTKSLI